MIQMLNQDGTVSFERIDNIRDNFEDAFAKKQLGAAMKDIVVKSVPNHVNNSTMFEDDNIKTILTNAISEIASTAYTEKELNGKAGYIGSLKETIKEYASMEADYRMEKATAVYEAVNDKIEASAEIRDIFSLENLKFSTEELKERFTSEMEYKYGSEAEDIVADIGKEVGAAIANAEEKNIIINETSKAITDQKKELEEELQIDDENPNENEDNSGDDTERVSSQDLDGSETEFDNDEEDPDIDGANDTAEETETVSEESFEFSEEGFSISEKDRSSVIEMLDREKEKILKIIMSNYDRIEESLKDMSGSKFGKDVDWQKNNIKLKLTKTEFEKLYKQKFDVSLDKLRGKKGNFITGNSKSKFDFDIAIVKGIENWKVWSIAITTILFGLLGAAIQIAIICNDENEKNIKEIKRRVKSELDYSFVKLIVKRHINKTHHPYTNDATIYLRTTFNLAKINKKGLESFKFDLPEVTRNIMTGVEEVDTVIESLKENIDNAIDEGQISIGVPDTTVHYQEPATTEPEQVSDYTNPDNEKSADNSDIDGVTDKPEITEGEPEDNSTAIASTLSIPTLNNMSSEDYREYTDLIFGNENLGKTLVPLSPVKFDSLPEFSEKTLTALYLRSTEGLTSLQNMMNARFDMLSEIVSREEDETLTAKLENYKKKSQEAFDDANIIRDMMNSIGLDTFGIENVNDPISLLVGSKFYHFAKGDLKFSTYSPKKEWKSVEDGINAAFDLALIKNELRKAHENKDADTMISLKNELGSRESLYYENLIGFEGDEEKKNAISNLIKLDDIDFSPEFIEVNKFTDSLKFAVDTTKVKTTKPEVSNEEKHKQIFDKAKNRIEFITNKDLTDDQKEIINAMIEGRDISDYAPTPFEKFVLKIGEDKVKEDRDFELGGESAGAIQDEACLRAVLYSFVNKVKPFSQKSIDEFNAYILGETA